MRENKKILRTGVIGFGKMGMLHAGILNSFAGVELVAICEVDKTILSSVGHLLPSLSPYDNYVEMLERETLDVVYITTPVFLHIKPALICTRKGIHTFIEKPVSVDAKECSELVEMVKTSNIKTCVGYFMRFYPSFEKARKIIEDHVLGEIYSFSASIHVSQLFKTGKGWRYEKSKSGGGVLMGQGTHLIDLLIYFFGAVDEVNGLTENWYSIETEDHACGMLKFKNGVTGTFDSCWSVRNKRVLTTRIEVFGKHGYLYVDQDTVKLNMDKKSKHFQKGWTVFSKPELTKGVSMDIAGPEYTIENELFINSIRNDQKLDNDIFSGYYVQQVIDAIYTSAGNNGNLQKVDNIQ